MIFNLLKKITIKEGVNVDPNVLKTIADRCNGDIRSAVNDLYSLCVNRNQVDIKALNVLGFRDREKDIFNALRDVFKTKNIKSIRENISHLDVDPGLVILWINENLPYEYIDINDLADGFDVLSKADVFLGRTNRLKNYSLWSYACDLMNGGVATSKTHSYPNDKYNFPTWLREKKASKNISDIRDGIISKLNLISHNSKKREKKFLISYFTHMFRNNTYFAIKMKKKLGLTENEIKYLFGEGHKHKIKEILLFNNQTEKIPQEKKLTNDVEDIKKDIQQTLFDF
jgi:replication factor C large subunit